MERLRAFGAAVLAMSLVSVPLWGATPNVAPLGTIIAAEHASLGKGTANVGTTVYAGDYIATDAQGSVQVRAGAARFLLQNASSAIVNQDGGSPSAKLLSGIATFSTANARAFTLFASKAAIRPSTDAPTIGQVKYVNEKELVVTARRGGLTITVEDQSQTIAEGTSYRVLLDPPPTAEDPSGASGGQPQQGTGGPVKAGRNNFVIFMTVAIGAGTGIAIYEALQSAERP
jgi:hypothetical protein